MEAQTIMTIIAALALMLSILGWAYQLGRSDARLVRNEKDISELQRQRDLNERASRREISDGFNKVYTKLDALPCHNPGWKKEQCQ